MAAHQDRAREDKFVQQSETFGFRTLCTFVYGDERYELHVNEANYILESTNQNKTIVLSLAKGSTTWSSAENLWGEAQSRTHPFPSVWYRPTFPFHRGRDMRGDEADE